MSKMEMPYEIYIGESGRITIWPQVYDQIANKDVFTKYYHARVVEALKAENEALKAELAKRQWQPIESAPKDGTEMLISDGIYIEKGIYQYCKFYVLNNGDYGDGGYGRDYDTSSKYSDYKPPTHWMPLPDAPEVK